MLQCATLKTSDTGYQYAMFDIENSKNVHHIVYMCRGQGSHRHCRNAGVHPHWAVQLLHASKMAHWVVMTPDSPVQCQNPPSVLLLKSITKHPPLIKIR